MNRRLLSILGFGVALSLLVPAPAGAQDFSPKSSFDISDTKVSANPELSFHLEQDDGEEAIDVIVLKIPKGFDVPEDKDIADGETLGSGEITIDFGPGCETGTPGTVPLNLPVDLVERDRTEEESKAKAVWVVDIGMGLQAIDVIITGSETKGHTLTAQVASEGSTPSAPTCAPFIFDLTVNQSAGDVEIWTNPSKPGSYTFQALFTSTEGKKKKISQKITITK